MAHRLHHLQKRKVEVADHAPEPQQPESNFSQSPGSGNGAKAAKQRGIRPILEPTNTFTLHEKQNYRKGMMTLPPPESLYEVRDTQLDPCFIRTTTTAVPSQPHKCGLPLGVWISPFANDRVHVVDVSAPLRCSRCKAYVNPYFQFDGARQSASCNLCGLRFNVDERVDKENVNSTAIATQELFDFRVSDKFYYKKRTDVINLVLAIELSQSMMEIGAYSTVLDSLKSVFESHEFEEKVRVAIVLFTDQGVCFLRPGEEEEEQPTVFMVPNNKNAVFCCPLSDAELFLKPNEQRDKVTGLIDFAEKYAESTWKKGHFNHSANYYNAIRCIR